MAEIKAREYNKKIKEYRMSPYRFNDLIVVNLFPKPRSKWKTLYWKFLIWSKGTWKERFEREKCKNCSWEKIEPIIKGAGYRPSSLMFHRIEGCERFEKRRQKRFIPPKTILE